MAYKSHRICWIDSVLIDAPTEISRADASLPTRWGDFRVSVFRFEGTEVVALARGELDGPEPVLVRLHSECLTGDVLGSLRCDCGDQLRASLAMIGAADRGVLLYLDHEGRGSGSSTRSARMASRTAASTRSMRTSSSASRSTPAIIRPRRRCSASWASSRCAS